MTLTDPAHAPFLAAICAAPGNDVKRLAYADWLDENEAQAECRTCRGRGYIAEIMRYDREIDQSTPRTKVDCPFCNGTGRVSNGCWDRGEFIRVQCELARLGQCQDECRNRIDYRCRRCQLADREAELWGSWPDNHDIRTHFHRQMRGTFPDAEWTILPASMAASLPSDGLSAVVSRGFIATIRAPLAALWEERECGDCHGSGLSDAPTGDFARQWPCDTCDMTGRVSGPTAAVRELVRCNPVERVEFADRSDTTHTWYREGWAEIDRTLPDPLFHSLPPSDESGGFGGERTYWGYGSRDLAIAALSDAYLGLCRG